MGTLAGNILYSKRISQPVMGMEFISHFDWIIDVKYGAIYAKQIKQFEPKDIYSNDCYRVDIYDTALRISLLPVGEKKYQLFDSIDSVNGEKVNADNVCQMKELLNTENGFKDNEITILPAQEEKALKE